MTGSGWAAPSGDAEPEEPERASTPSEFPPAAPADDTPPYYQPLPGGAEGWGTPALPPGSFPPPPQQFGGGPASAWQDIKPGIAPLRPLTTAELVDGAFATLRRYPRAILLPGAVLSIVDTVIVLLIQAITNRQGDLNSGAGIAGLVAAVLILVVTGLAGVLLAGVAAAIVQRGILGEPITFAHAWEAVRPRAWAILGAALLTSLLWVVAALFALLPGIYVYVALRFTSVVLVVEGGTVRSSIRRSWRLVRGSWWRTFGLLLVVTIIAGVIGTVISIPFNAASFGSIFGGGQSSVSFGDEALADIGRLLAGIVTVPFTSAAIALIYIDRRMRDEGLDVALRQAAGA